MRIKNNPWVSMVALLLLAVILVLACTGCGVNAASAPARFSCEPAGYAEDSRFYIITDTETDVQYLLVTGSGLIKLEG